MVIRRNPAIIAILIYFCQRRRLLPVFDAAALHDQYYFATT